MDALRQVFWVGSSLEDLREFPDDVKDEVGYALHEAQAGGKSRHAKPLKSFGGASVLEIVDDYDGDTYRAVYTVRFAEAIYVLHCFQKKSTSGKKTSKSDMDLVKSRLKVAEEEHKRWKNEV